jgi:DNA-binding CsgD family transcriptional regulator
MGVPTRYPVILGPTDDGGVAVVHFTIRDNQTFVHLDPDDVIARRLVAAKAVFGLSPGQLRVAQKIASGQGLKTLAQDLGISVNTARTHLSRLYDKTGVSSQPALVRLLLSIG